jgi:hypothetical protein
MITSLGKQLTELGLVYSDGAVTYVNAEAEVDCVLVFRLGPS